LRLLPKGQVLQRVARLEEFEPELLELPGPEPQQAAQALRAALLPEEQVLLLVPWLQRAPPAQERQQAASEQLLPQCPSLPSRP